MYVSFLRSKLLQEHFLANHGKTRKISCYTVFGLRICTVIFMASNLVQSGFEKSLGTKLSALYFTSILSLSCRGEKFKRESAGDMRFR